MKYLLDVNMLVAWGWKDHVDHARAAHWILAQKSRKDTRLLTSAIPQLGFVRVSVQRSEGKLTPQQAGSVLAGMLASLGSCHDFLPDDQTSTDWPDWCRGAARTTDAHLLALARAHQAELATLDKGIPGALCIP